MPPIIITLTAIVELSYAMVAWRDGLFYLFPGCNLHTKLLSALKYYLLCPCLPSVHVQAMPCCRQEYQCLCDDDEESNVCQAYSCFPIRFNSIWLLGNNSACCT